MRVRWILSMMVLAVTLSVRPAQAGEAPVAFQRDGTYFHSIHAQLLARQSRAESDSTESPKTTYLLGGGALVGLAAYFVSSSAGSGQPTFPGFPQPKDGDDILLPPQDAPQAPAPTGTWGPPTGGGDPAPGVDGPVTVTPEPVSMALLATGLGGLGGASLRRRLRKS
jgi:hypothetical protein